MQFTALTVVTQVLVFVVLSPMVVNYSLFPFAEYERTKTCMVSCLYFLSIPKNYRLRFEFCRGVYVEFRS